MFLIHHIMKRLLTTLLIIGVVQVSFGQLANTAHVSSMGGGIVSGGNYESAVVVGDPAASSNVALSDDVASYAGFVPGSLIVLSFGLEKDSAVLAVLYQELDGENWTDNSGWLQSDDIESWSGVTLDNQRVVGLSLPSNGLQNNLPDIIRNLIKLDSINVSDNELRKLPDLTSMPNLSRLNVAENRLGFESLIRNLAIGEFDYSPQKRIGFTKNDTVPADSSFVLTATISGTNNAYQWVFDDLPDPVQAVDVDGATTRELALSNLNYENMGAYRLRATNESLPGLVLESRNQNIWASTNVQGTVLADGSGTSLTAGQVEIYRIYEGPFELSDSAQLDNQGFYQIEDVVLGDFILLVRQDNELFPDVQQTYYVSTPDWIDADTLFLRSAADDINIEMALKPDPDPVANGADVVGSVESDFADAVDEEGNRINARRKVKRAACSIRRFVPRGRDEQEEGEYELYAYVESDDDGNFTFTDIDEGTYRLNIEYPGVPMDESSEIEFVVGGDEENQVFEVAAVVTEEGIVVKTTKVLWSKKPFLKNIRLFPNPTDGKMSAEFLVYRKIDDLFGTVRDIQGSVLIRKELNPSMGYQEMGVDLSSYESGVYFLEFSDSSGSFRQLIKLRRK